MKAIEVDVNGAIWVVNQGGYIFTMLNDQWLQIPGMAKDIVTIGDLQAMIVSEIWVVPAIEQSLTPGDVYKADGPNFKTWEEINIESNRGD